MFCTNCGRIVKEGELYCANCGHKLDSSTLQTNSQDTNYDEDLIDAFIGKHAIVIKNQRFSWYVFHFQLCYLIYRKMWISSLILFMVSFIILQVIKNLSLGCVVIFIIYFILAFIFKDIYMNHVKKSVKKIKEKNRGKDRTEIIEICKKKGGTSIIGIIIGLIVVAVLSIL